MEPVGVTYALLIALGAATIGMMVVSGRSLLDFEFQLQLTVAIVGWFAISILAGKLMSRRRGYDGPDPRSALGLAVVAMLRSELPGDAAQARRVALGGFEAMTDTPLRKAIQGTDADSVWRIPRRREEAFGIDLVAMDLAQPGGGDGDGGDGGD